MVFPNAMAGGPESRKSLDFRDFAACEPLNRGGWLDKEICDFVLAVIFRANQYKLLSFTREPYWRDRALDEHC
jgi:hypothetical protein